MKFHHSIVVASSLALAACGGGEETGASEDVAGETAEEGGRAIVPTPAAGYFELQPGLWERTVRAATGTAPAPQRICIDEETRSRINPTNEIRGLVEDCTLIEQSEATMFGVIATFQCNQPKVEAGVVMRYDDGEVKTDINAANEAGNGFAGVAVMRRIGDCPSGMSPGDVADSSGQVTGALPN